MILEILATLISGSFGQWDVAKAADTVPCNSRIQMLQSGAGQIATIDGGKDNRICLQSANGKHMLTINDTGSVLVLSDTGRMEKALYYNGANPVGTYRLYVGLDGDLHLSGPTTDGAIRVLWSMGIRCPVSLPYYTLSLSDSGDIVVSGGSSASDHKMRWSANRGMVCAS